VNFTCAVSERREDGDRGECSCGVVPATAAEVATERAMGMQAETQAQRPARMATTTTVRLVARATVDWKAAR